MAKLFVNEVPTDENSISMLMHHFADPFTENGMFVAACEQVRDTGRFEFVKDNDVYLIKDA